MVVYLVLTTRSKTVVFDHHPDIAIMVDWVLKKTRSCIWPFTTTVRSDYLPQVMFDHLPLQCVSVFTINVGLPINTVVSVYHHSHIYLPLQLCLSNYHHNHVCPQPQLCLFTTSHVWLFTTSQVWLFTTIVMFECVQLECVECVHSCVSLFTTSHVWLVTTSHI